MLLAKSRGQDKKGICLFDRIKARASTAIPLKPATEKQDEIGINLFSLFLNPEARILTSAFSPPLTKSLKDLRIQ